MNPAQITHDRAADHNVVKMRDDEISVSYVNVQPQRGQEKHGHPPDGKQTYKAEGIEHRRVIGYRTLIECCRPVEYLDRRRDGYGVAEEREDHSGVHALAADEHVVTPDQEAEDGNRHARPGDEAVAEDPLPGHIRDQLADHAHRR